MTDYGLITVWGVVSLRAHRVHWALQELGLDYRVEPIQSRTGETLTSAYTALNPRQKIPCLQDGELVISESAAILNHLYRTYGAGRNVFVPTTSAEMALSDEWCFTIMAEMDAHSLYLIRRHKGLAHIYGAAPAAVDSAIEYFQKQLAAVRPRIAAAPDCLFGDQVGVADILLTSVLDWAVKYEIEIDDDSASYLARMQARTAYRLGWETCALPDGVAEGA
jgi:glutathione S-transferase